MRKTPTIGHIPIDCLCPVYYFLQMKTLHVTIPGASYPIHIGAGILGDALMDVVKNTGANHVVTVTNDTLEKLYPGHIAKTLEPLGIRVDNVVVPDGERFKNLETLSGLYDRLMSLAANRKTLMIAFGGGVIGDMAGLAAATFMRGIPMVQVPTTLLSFVDSSVGGKTAVNHPHGKNTIGAFKQPVGVVMDLEFLKTLPERELIAGLFELIKHGIIRDADFFDFLEQGKARFRELDWAFWEEAVYRSCQIKAAVVQQDEKETDLRAILNFGHTLAHLIETHTRYEKYLHGEAVGVGMLYAAYVSSQWGELPTAQLERIRGVLEPLARPVEMPRLSEKSFSELLMHDKKASNQSLRFVLVKGLGGAFYRDQTTPSELWPLFNGFLREMPDVMRVT